MIILFPILDLSIINFRDIKMKLIVSQHYRAWSDCTDMQAGLALFTTFSFSRVRVNIIIAEQQKSIIFWNQVFKVYLKWIVVHLLKMMLQTQVSKWICTGKSPSCISCLYEYRLHSRLVYSKLTGHLGMWTDSLWFRIVWLTVPKYCIFYEYMLKLYMLYGLVTFINKICSVLNGSWTTIASYLTTIALYLKQSFSINIAMTLKFDILMTYKNNMIIFLQKMYKML